MKTRFEKLKDIYYLESIERHLDEVSKMVTDGPSLGGEVLADNRNWLAGYIANLRAVATND